MSDAEKAAPGCERITVALEPAAAAELAALRRRRLTKTAAVNRALRVYGSLRREADGGAEVLVRRPDGTVLQVMFL